jgi:hypothetical protein
LARTLPVPSGDFSEIALKCCRKTRIDRPLPSLRRDFPAFRRTADDPAGMAADAGSIGNAPVIARR